MVMCCVDVIYVLVNLAATCSAENGTTNQRSGISMWYLEPTIIGQFEVGLSDVEGKRRGLRHFLMSTMLQTFNNALCGEQLDLAECPPDRLLDCEVTRAICGLVCVMICVCVCVCMCVLQFQEIFVVFENDGQVFEYYGNCPTHRTVCLQVSHGDVPQALWAMGVVLSDDEKDEVVNIVLRSSQPVSTYH